MSWAKLDDRANEHRKQLAAGAEACWLWACGLMYCNRQPARDGFIPDQMLPMLYPLSPAKRTKLAERLVEVGLWLKVAGGYQVHDFTEWNHTREQAEAEREATRLRVAEHRRNKKRMEEGNAVTPLHVTQARNADVPDPLPSAPLPIQSNPADAAVGIQLESAENRSLATPCPLDLDQRLISLGVHLELAQHLKCDPESIVAELKEFKNTWVVGKFAGQSRSHWAGKARQWVIGQHKQGLLKAPGAIQHEEKLSDEAAARVKRAAERGLARIQGGIKS